MSNSSSKPAEDSPQPEPSSGNGGLGSPGSAAGDVAGGVDNRIHRGAGDILDWATGSGNDDVDEYDLADTVDVSSTVDEMVVYLDGYLDDDQRRRVEQRLVEDESSRANLAALQNSWDALDCLPRPTCSSDFTESTMKLVVQKELATRSTSKGFRQALKWSGVAATLLFSLGMGYLATRHWETANEREFFESYRLVRDWEKYELIGDFEFLVRLEKEGWFAREVPHVEP
jgi:hypothetical protein